MAARRLLIVMLILLGISTLAAALVPQSTLNDDQSTTRSTTTHATTTTTSEPPPGRDLRQTITVGPKLRPQVLGPVCAKGASKCEAPIHVGDQLTLLVRSDPAAQLEIPKLGLVGFASPEAPAQFEIFPTSPGDIGIVFVTTQRVAATVQVLSDAAARKAKRAKRPARAESGRP